MRFICVHVSLLHYIPCCVYMHDTIYHLAAVTHVRRHAGRVRVLVGVCFRNRCVHCGFYGETECRTVFRQECTCSKRLI